MMKSCMTCGMPLEGAHTNDIAFETPEGFVCVFDSHEGAIKPGEEIFEGGVQFFLSEVTHGDQDLAERLTRKNMNTLPYWQSHPFGRLEGPLATEEEFQKAMSLL
ncbi:MAG: hypothetical protein NTX72_03020 [Candidatus Uhrbacteria bacterium]|nr:hypothetical protein [Candidatus Uhrbacteria bacterium]